MNTTLNISMPVNMKSTIQQVVGAGNYSTPSDYIRSLVRDDIARQEGRHIDALVTQAILSGEPEKMTKSSWANFHKVGDALLKESRNSQ